MDSAILYRFFLLILLLNLSAFFSGSETAFFSLDTLKLSQLENENSFVATVILKLVRQRERLLTTILLGNEIVNVAISSVSASLFMRLLGDRWVALSVFITTFFILFYGEMLPKLFAVKHNILWAKLASLPLYMFTVLTFPLRWILEGISKLVTALVGTEEGHIKEEEFKSLVKEAQIKGEIEEKEKDMIYKVFRFTEITVSHVMVPEPDIFMVSVDTDIKELADALKKPENRHSKIPVYEGVRDNVLGYVHIKDLLPVFKGLEEKSLKELILPCLFVPKTKPVQEMLEEFQKKKIDIAIVVDEYGSVEGLVTLEDILEEIVGEIQDEFDREREMVKEISENEILLDATLPIYEAKEIIGLEVPDNLDVDTIGGYVLHLFGGIPEEKEEVEADGWRFVVDKMRGKRIIKIRAIKKNNEISGYKK